MLESLTPIPTSLDKILEECWPTTRIRLAEYSLFSSAEASYRSQTSGGSRLHSLHEGLVEPAEERRKREPQQFTVNCPVQRISLSPFCSVYGPYLTFNKRSLNVSCIKKTYQVSTYPFPCWGTWARFFHCLSHITWGCNALLQGKNAYPTTELPELCWSPPARGMKVET